MEAMEVLSRSPDQVSLVRPPTQKFPSIYLLPLFLAFKVGPFVAYFLPTSTPLLSMTVFTIFVVTDLWICRHTFGYPLAGLTWSLDSFPVVRYRFRPRPFAQSVIETSLFWFANIAHLILLLLLTIRNLRRRKLIWTTLLTILSVMDCANVTLYFKCRGLALKFQSTPAVSDPLRTALQQFPRAGDTGADDDEKIPDPVTPAYFDSE
jgi:hypothetical protein